jgi:hypothetical protein
MAGNPHGLTVASIAARAKSKAVAKIKPLRKPSKADPCDDIVNACEQAIGHGYDLSDQFSLVDVEGRYASQDRTYHPLEAVIVGNYINCPINYDIGYQLGVKPSWIDGFVDGYAAVDKSKEYGTLRPGDLLRKRYCSGYAAGVKIRQFIIEHT